MSEKESHWRPRLAIAALIAGVVLYDALCPKGETITEEVRRLRQTKLGQFVVPFLVRSTAAHLLEEVEPEHDWIHQITQLSPKHD